MLKKSTILLFAAFCFFALKGDGCNSGGNFHSYTMAWSYDCSVFKVPASFNYGYVSGVTYQTLGNLPVNSCAGLKTFRVAGMSNKISKSTTFYVRSYYTNPTQYSDVTLARPAVAALAEGELTATLN